MSDVEAGLQPETVEPAGLDAILTANIDKAFAEPDEPSGETPEPVIDADGRARGPDGKFVSTKPAEPEAPVIDGSAPVEAKPADPAAVDPAKAQPIDAHPRWSAELKAEFAKWPPEVQKAFRERHDAADADYTRKTQELSETRKSVEPFLNEAKRLEPLFQRWQTTPQDFMQRSAQVVNSLTSPNVQERVSTVANLVQHYQVPLDGLLHALGIPIPQVGQDGQVAPIDPTVLQLRQTVTSLSGQLQQIQEQSRNFERQRAEAEFNALGQAKDEKGTAKFPHFERVKQSMIQLVADGLAESWDQAYSKSVRLDDDLHKQVIDEERARALAEQERQRQEAVDKAKKAAPVRTSNGSPNGAAKPKGLDAHLDAALDRAGLGG
jgi:hypothetical protein